MRGRRGTGALVVRLIGTALLALMAVACDGDEGSSAPASDATPTNVPAAESVGVAPELSMIGEPLSAKGLTGEYHGKSADGTTTSSLSLKQDGDRLTGKVDDTVLTGTVSGNSASGKISDPSSSESADFRLTLAGDVIDFRITVVHPDTGQKVTVPIKYTRGAAPAVAVARDPRVVGRWRHTYAQASGGFSVAVDNWLILEPDGTASEGPSVAAGGSASTGFESRGGGKPLGKWRTENKILYLMGPGSTQWAPYARYAVTDENMMLT